MTCTAPTRSTRAATLCTLAAPLLLGACTSVQWMDSSGTTHHLGLFVYELEERPYGTRLSRTGLGLDLRLSGPERGYSLGLKKSVRYRPDTVLVYDPDTLPDLVAEYVLSPMPASEPARTRWGFFYLQEDVTREATAIDDTIVGMEWRWGPAGPGLAAGFSNLNHFVGRAVQDGVVQIHSRDADAPERWELRMWQLAPAPDAPATANATNDESEAGR